MRKNWTWNNAEIGTSKQTAYRSIIHMYISALNVFFVINHSLLLNPEKYFCVIVICILFFGEYEIDTHTYIFNKQPPSLNAILHAYSTVSVFYYF